MAVSNVSLSMEHVAICHRSKVIDHRSSKQLIPENNVSFFGHLHAIHFTWVFQKTAAGVVGDISRNALQMEMA
jgi:hypothetical protein